jgi:hypothetical protein
VGAERPHRNGLAFGRDSHAPNVAS